MGNMEGGLIYQRISGKGVEEISGDGHLSPQGPIEEPVEFGDWVF